MKKRIIIAAVLAVMCTAAVSCGTVENLNEQSTVKIQTTTEESSKPAEVTSEEAATTAAETKAAAEKTTVEETTAVIVEEPTEAENDESSLEDPQVPETDAPEIEAPTDPPVEEAPATEAPTEEPAAPAAVGSFDNSDLSFNGGSLLGDASGLVGAMGAPSSVDEAAGCLSNGADQKIYHFGGVDVSCYVQDGAEYIYDITITGGYTTSKGIGIGSSKADVIAAYGEGADSGQYILYGSGDYGLYIYFSGDSVSMIDYYAAV